LNGTYYPANDIDAIGQPAWIPIGSPFNPFTGTLDGNNHVIKNLQIPSNGGYYTGMFSGTQGATIKNLGLTNVKVTGGGFTAGLVGYMVDSILTRVYVTGTVTANSSVWVQGVGLAVGKMVGTSTVTRSYATGTAKGAAYSIGGFAGEYDGCGIGDFHFQGFHEVFTNVNVSPNTSTSGDVIAGGLVGLVTGGWIEDISTVGPTTGRNWAGGVVGYFDTVDCSPGFTDILSRGNVHVVNASPARAGAIGGWDTNGYWFRCGSAFWDTGTDPGSLVSRSGGCEQLGYDDATLRAPHPSPGLLIYPFIHSTLQTTYPFAGSDGEWGFGYTDPAVWGLNANNQHITLLNIPNPGVQPKWRTNSALRAYLVTPRSVGRNETERAGSVEPSANSAASVANPRDA
jgi:hypothetical protein